ncbi:G-protein coupled receptor 54-like [Branchiostoma floridae x Branchiostoma japonicum]
MSSLLNCTTNITSSDSSFEDVSNSSCSEEVAVGAGKIPEPLPIPISWDNYVPPAIFAVIFLVGISGNSLVIYVVAFFRKMRTVTNFYLCNLAVTDLAFLVCCVPFTAAQYAMPSWVFGQHMCRMVNYMMQVTVQATCLTLAAVSVDRYCAIVHPVTSLIFRRKRVAVAGSVIIWIVSFLMGIPDLLHYRLLQRNWDIVPDGYSAPPALPSATAELGVKIHPSVSFLMGIPDLLHYRLLQRNWDIVPDGHPGPPALPPATAELGVKIHPSVSFLMGIPDLLHYRLLQLNWEPYGWQTICRPVWPSKDYERGYMIYSVLSTYFIPFVITCVPIIYRLWHRFDNVTVPPGNVEKTKKSTLMVIGVVVLFTLCWLPNHVINLWWHSSSNKRLTAAVYYSKFVGICLSYANSAMNPFVYAIVGDSFRDCIKQTFSRKKHQRLSAKTRRTRPRRMPLVDSRIASRNLSGLSRTCSSSTKVQLYATVSDDTETQPTKFTCHEAESTV